jgi:hypothetical protein
MKTKAKGLSFIVAIGFAAWSAEAQAGVYWTDLSAAADVNLGVTELTKNSAYDSRANAPLGLTSNAVNAAVTGNNQSASASAAANLAQGALRASASGSNFGSAEANASFFDTLQFSVPGAGVSTVTDIGVSLRLDGTTAASEGSTFTQALSFTIGGSGEASSGGYIYNHEVQADPFPNGSTNDVTFNTWLYNSVSNSGLNGVDFSAVFGIQGANPEITIQEMLTIGAADGANLNFSDTAALGLTLPSGVTYTSASGVFLTEPLSDVPEPSSLTLLGAGVVGLVLLGLQRNFRKSLPRAF